MRVVDVETIQKANELVDQLIQTKCPTSDLFQVMAQLVQQGAPEEVCLRVWAAIETDLRACDALMCNISVNAINLLEFYQDYLRAEEYPQLAVATTRFWLNKAPDSDYMYMVVQHAPPELEAEIIQRLETMTLDHLAIYSIWNQTGENLPRLKTWLTRKLLEQQPSTSAEELERVIEGRAVPVHWRECAAQLLLQGRWWSRQILEHSRFRAFRERMGWNIHGPSRADLLCVMKHIPSMRTKVWPKILDKRATWEELLDLLQFMDNDWKAVVLDRLICAGSTIPRALALSYYAPEAALELLRFGRLPVTDQHIFNILLDHGKYPQEIIQFAWEWARPKIGTPPFTWELMTDWVFYAPLKPTRAKDLLALIIERGDRRAAFSFLCQCSEPDLAITAWVWLMLMGRFETPNTEEVACMAQQTLIHHPGIEAKAEELLANQATPASMRQNIQSFKETLANLRKPTPEQEIRAKTEAILNLFSPGRK